MTYQSRGLLKCVLCESTKTVGRRLCRRCYQAELRAGRLNQHKVLGPTDIFETRIKKTDSCWLWTGTKNYYGYGVFLLPGERAVRAHRYAYQHFVGKIPRGKIIMHTCDNPPCVNPSHLLVGTKESNNKDTASKQRHHYGLDHWNGKLSDSNLRAILASSETQSVLAKRYGVSQSYISRLKQGLRRTRVMRA